MTSFARTGAPAVAVYFLLLQTLSQLSYILPSPPNLEVLSIKILNRKQPIILCCVYNPPISEIQYFNSLISYFTTLANTDDSFVLLGDFNLPDISWSSLSGTSINSNFFCDFVFQYNLFQMIESPTHIQGNVLALILTNDLELVTDLVILPHQSQVISSDHLMITFSIFLFSTLFLQSSYLCF